jgi:Raf kinase inhibitor-like YbhB/YbcL family protein
MAVSVVIAFAAGPVVAQTFTLTSSAFQDGGWLQQKNIGSDAKRNPDCVGDNVSPPLAWSNVPAKATSLALLMFNPEGRTGAGVSHWVAYGIAPLVTGFAENEGGKASPNFVSGTGTAKQSIYIGPCTPAGAPYHYAFTMIATTLALTDLPAGLTREQFFERSEGKRVASTGLIGLWAKK